MSVIVFAKFSASSIWEVLFKGARWEWKREWKRNLGKNGVALTAEASRLFAENWAIGNY